MFNAQRLVFVHLSNNIRTQDSDRKEKGGRKRANSKRDDRKFIRALLTDKQLNNESAFTIQSHSGNNYVQRRSGEEFSPPCLLPTIKHLAFVMICSCMFAKGVGPMTIIVGMMNADKDIKVLKKTDAKHSGPWNE